MLLLLARSDPLQAISSHEDGVQQVLHCIQQQLAWQVLRHAQQPVAWTAVPALQASTSQ